MKLFYNEHIAFITDVHDSGDAIISTISRDDIGVLVQGLMNKSRFNWYYLNEDVLNYVQKFTDKTHNLKIKTFESLEEIVNEFEEYFI